MPMLKVRRAGDQYNGDLSCVEIIADHLLCADIPAPEPEPKFDQDFHAHYGVLIVRGAFASCAADLYEWYGSNGEGKLAAETIIPRPGWQLEWLPDPEN